jgi:exo-1,4-beta-D-glucosaminidase
LKYTAFVFLAAFILGSGFSEVAFAQTQVLKSAWRIQNSESVRMAGGATISMPNFDDHTWTAATVPSTVLANLAGPHVGDGSVDDPYYGKNWLKLPGSGPYYPMGKNYGKETTPPESPFGHPWWYRTSFSVSSSEVLKFADLHFKGITYGADIWLNGVRIADSSATKGSYRQFKFDITSHLKVGVNTLAVLVSPPIPTDLTPSWVDWNITPQDKNMGLWREVFIRFHGPVSVGRSFVSTELPAADEADLTVESIVTNNSPKALAGVIRAELLGFTLNMPVTLNAGESRRVQFTPSQFAQLKVSKPKLWWPWQMGAPVLNSLRVSFLVGAVASDTQSQPFGIRKVESHLTPDGSRLFVINGRPIFIRGGGWASDLLLRFNSTRQDRELNYVKMLGLNTIRLEGRFETERLLTLADQKGLLVMPGWVCCNAWQDNVGWDETHRDIARASLVDQLYELRSHASVFVFLYGSDEVPSPGVESLYLSALKETNWPNPSLASASDDTSTVGRTGVKMTGPYAYTPPSYWYVDKQNHGGAWGFNTETSPGISMPPLESLQQFIPPDHFLADDDMWSFHMGENEFTNLDTHKAAIERRYGKIKSVPDLVMKSEVMDYDNHRAMFEAYASNKYHSATGVVQWMLNSAWPSLMWHLYDFYLRPNAAFYGVRKANAPLHVSLDPSSLTVSVVNSTYTDSGALELTAKMIDLKSQVFFADSHRAFVVADSAEAVMKLPEPTSPGQGTYFVSLELKNSTGAVVDHNFYWLSTKKEVYAWAQTDFKMTPLIQEGDFSTLQDLGPASVKATLKTTPTGGVVTITNIGKSLAFFVKLRLKSGKVDVIPVDWDDNDIALLPGETRVIAVRVPEKQSAPLALFGSGWNVEAW